MLSLTRSWNRHKAFTATLTLALLAIQVLIPWAGEYFVTQDGPSHLYAALVARDLLIRSNSDYSAVYEMARQIKSNWGTVVLFNLSSTLVGVENAEKLVASICIVIGVSALWYFAGSFDRRVILIGPIANFLLNVWFLWVGFYNFYLAMAFAPFLVGYYIRKARVLTWRSVITLSVGLVAQFFVHVLAAAITGLLIVVVGIWLNIAMEFPSLRSQTVFRESATAIIKLVLIVLAPAVLGLLLLSHSLDRGWSSPEVLDALQSFPKHVFASSVGRAGEQVLLCMPMMFYMIIGLLSMTACEWKTARGGIVVGVTLLFMGYLFIPDYFFGGGEVKMRFAWGVFLFGCSTAATVRGTKTIQQAVTIYVTCCLGVTLHNAMEYNVRRVSPAVSEYVKVLDRLPQGGTFVRLKCSLREARKHFGFDELALEPLWHVDALVAAKRKMIDLSDYQAATGDFPVVYKTVVSDEKRWQLVDLEGTGPNGYKSLISLVGQPPVSIDCVILLGENNAYESNSVLTIFDQPNRKAWRTGDHGAISGFAQGTCRVIPKVSGR